jgi:hypothetical protein
MTNIYCLPVMLRFPYFFLGSRREEMVKLFNDKNYCSDPLLLMPENVHYEPIGSVSAKKDPVTGEKTAWGFATPWHGYLSAGCYTERERIGSAQIHVWGFMFAESVKELLTACLDLKLRENVDVRPYPEAVIELNQKFDREALTKLMNEQLAKVENKENYVSYKPYPRELLVENYFGVTERSVWLEDVETIPDFPNKALEEDAFNQEGT